MSEHEQIFQSLPSEELVHHALRKLSYDERMTGTSASPAVGNQRMDLYSFAQVGAFLIGTNWEDLLSEGTKASLNYLDVDTLVVWLREVIGDTELADAVETRTAELGSYKAKTDEAGVLFKARFTQYLEVIEPPEEQLDDEVQEAG